MSWLLLGVMIVLLMMSSSPRYRPMYDLVLALAVFPALIAIGASVEPGLQGKRIFAFLGAISFPLYAVHYPIIELARRVVRMAGSTPAATAPWSGLILLAGLVAIAWLLSLVDVPARHMLRRAISARLRAPAVT